MPHKKELDASLLAIHAINPFVAYSTSSRLQMVGSHIGSSLVMHKPSPRRIQTLYEREYSKYTFSLKAPCNMNVIKVFQQYRETHGAGGIRKNPRRFVLYENFNTNQFGIVEINTFHCIHKDFGFRYVDNPAVTLYPKAKVAEGTILADSPTIDAEGNYCIGKDVKVAFISDQSTLEDGIWASNEICEEMAIDVYGTRDAKWGKRRYPVNIYGDDTVYKICPDIGEVVREDGLIFALREHDPLLAPVKMSTKALQRVDYMHDRLEYGEPGARVIDITVHRDPNNRLGTPVGMAAQIDKYADAMEAFYIELVAEYERLFKDRYKRGGLHITPELESLMERAYASVGKPGVRKPQYTIRGVPIDEYYVELVFESKFVPGIGSKLSDLHGGKGIICKKTPRAHMHTDTDGNVADIVMDGDSTVKRTNVGRMYEHGFGAYMRDYTKHIREFCGLHRDHVDPIAVQMVIKNRELVNAALNMLIEFYSVISPAFGDDVRELTMLESDYAAVHLRNVLLNGIYIEMATDNAPLITDTVKTLRDNYPLTFGPVTYINTQNEVVKTIENVLIGNMYIIVLDKIGAFPAAVSSARVQHFGILAKVTNLDKYAYPWRNQPGRFWGEAEARLATAYVGGDFVAEALDRSNNPLKRKDICRNIFMAPNPMDIDSVVDYDKFPQHNSRMTAYVKHIAGCYGSKFVRDPIVKERG